MTRPALRTEIDEIHATLSEQIAAIRAATLQLSDDQCRSRPLRSQLSLSGLIKHSCHIFIGTLRQLGQEPPATDPVADFYGSFTPDETEAVDVLLDRFDELSERYLAATAAMDPDALVQSGPAPWDDVPRSVPVRTRFQLIHHIEEFARHAGHADIIREQIDGAQAMGLKFAVEGRPGNDFVQPWTPEQPSA